MHHSGDSPDQRKKYLEFLRLLFKNGGTTSRIFVAVYMTGILPIKKDGSQSAISDFCEYTMLMPGDFGRYAGFTEEEVESLCKKADVSFTKAKSWYDGYTAGREHSLYNPYSVMSAIRNRKFTSYWKKTSAAESLLTYIDMDEAGLQDSIIRLIAGETIEIDTDGFQNDFVSFSDQNDVLTLLIHLGYLTYEERDCSEDGITAGCVRIPNREVALEFEKLIRKAKHKEIVRLINNSDRLLKDILRGDEEAVARAFEVLRDTEYAPAWYNSEQALRYMIKFAYISSIEQYLRLEELPTGHGLADIFFYRRGVRFFRLW